MGRAVRWAPRCGALPLSVATALRGARGAAGAPGYAQASPSSVCPRTPRRAGAAFLSRHWGPGCIRMLVPGAALSVQAL
eukprot:14778079-Alexandrium_andersonii.AAC.1